jgi:SpoIIAA-like
MSADIVSDASGILTARIIGKLPQPELAALQAPAIDHIRKQGKVRILILAEDFQGWRQGDDWSEVSFMEYDPHIEKMAIVGEEKWEQLALVFAAGPIRKFPIEYFQPADLERARAWLAAE